MNKVVDDCYTSFIFVTMPTDETKWGHIHVRLKPETMEKLKATVREERRTMTAVVENALEKYFQQK